jgi:outer membrane protein OmpA-like peptidoglycan-associated protein
MKRLYNNILKITLLGIGTLSLAAVAETSENFENKWHVSDSLFQCEMKSDLPGFGEVFFTKKSGLELGFRLTLLSPLGFEGSKNQELILYVKNPDWVDSGRMMVLGSVPLTLKNEQAIVLPPAVREKVKQKKQVKNKTVKLTYDLLTVNQLWQTLESGNNIVFHDPATNQTQFISAVGFRDAQQKYRQCLANMIPYDFDTLKLTRLYFPSGSAAITSENKQKLDIVIEQILNDEYISKIELGGHSDIVGGYTDNRILANRRLWAVKDYLVFRGVPADLIEARGYGDTKPIAPHNSKEGRAKNRRVEVKLSH